MIIYKAENIINGKVYIGQTRKKLHERIADHKYNSKLKDGHFQRAIRKYGFDKFIWSIIDTAESFEELNEKEAYCVDYYDSYNNGYNSTVGGEDNPMNHAEIREKISVAKNKWYEKAGNNGAFLGKNHTEETKKKMRKAALGRKRSEEDRAKQGKSRRKGIEDGTITFPTGKDHPNSIQIEQVDIDTGEVINTFDSIVEAEIALKGKRTGTIWKVISPECPHNHTAYGFEWRKVNKM
jgi:group I intron endonuclease